jgi:hypothetical protein
MEKRTLLTYLCLGIAVYMLVPADVLATTQQGAKSLFDDNALRDMGEHTSKIQNFLFGPPVRIAGVLGGAYGLLQSVLTSSIKPVITFGGIALAVNLIPKFVDAVFNVSTILLP